MPLPRYKIYKPGGPVGRGVTDAYYVNVTGIAKSDKNGSNIVLNEYVCHHLATGLMLPVPTGFVIDRSGESHFVSLDFTFAGEDLPPADVQFLIANQGFFAIGIILFDIWIMNSDRHIRNIAYDTINNRVQIFDHSHSLFGFGDIKMHLAQNVKKPYIDRHCLAQEIKSVEGMREWNDRINQLPEFYIREGIKNGEALGLPADITDLCTKFMLDRRMMLLRLIHDNQYLFPNIPKSEWEKLKDAI